MRTLERLLRASGFSLRMYAEPAGAADLSTKRAVALRRHRQKILDLARRAGASNVRIFGSVARGEDEADSDIDLLVDFDESQGLLPIVDLKQQLEQLLDESVDVAPESLLKGAIRRAALHEAVPL